MATDVARLEVEEVGHLLDQKNGEVMLYSIAISKHRYYWSETHYGRMEDTTERYRTSLSRDFYSILAPWDFWQPLSLNPDYLPKFRMAYEKDLTREAYRPGKLSAAYQAWHEWLSAEAASFGGMGGGEDCFDELDD